MAPLASETTNGSGGLLDPDTEAALRAFVEPWREETGTTVRSLVHAWASGGGRVQVGNVAVRLLASTGLSDFTAGTVHAPHGDQPFPRLELCRVLVESHGVPHDDWVHWSDEFADLGHHGFDPTLKFPTLTIDDDVTPAEVARLATGLRDLARMAGA